MSPAKRISEKPDSICEIYYDDQPIGESISAVRSAIEAYIDLPARIDSTLSNFRIDGSALQVEDHRIRGLKAVNANLEAARTELLRTDTISLVAELTEALVDGSVRTTRTVFEMTWSDLSDPDFSAICNGPKNRSDIKALYSAWNAFWELRVDLERWHAVANTLEQFNIDASASQERLALKDGKLHQVKFVSIWSKRRTANVDLKANPFWTALLSDRAKKVRQELIGTDSSTAAASYPIALEPERSVHFAISPGLIYSFIDQPSFSATEDGAGGFAIQESNDDSGELDGAVALNICPDRFYKQDFKPFLQVGVVPGDDIGFLLGVGAKLGDGVTLAIGAAFQEVDELRGGQQVGDIIASEDALSVGDDYDTGIYINLSYDIGIF